MKIISTLILAGAVALATVTGCTMNPSKSHIVRAVATGTKLGVTQNPTTGVYELGVQRVQTEIITVPVYAYTNKDGSVNLVVPESVSRYEVNTHSAVFGNAALTSTLATGTNGVATQVGGQTPPINVSTGTSNNLTPISH
jgi:hypothetical protein